MTVYHGKNASFTAAQGTFLGSATNSWTVTTLADIADATEMGDTWEESVDGLTDFNASVESNVSLTANYIEDLGVSGELTFQVVSGGPNLVGTAILTGISETTTIDDIGKVSQTYEGNDAAGLVFAST